MPNFVRHTPVTYEQLGSTISNCSSIEEAARRAFNNRRYTDPVAFLRETNGRTVVAFIRVQDDDGTFSIRKLESFSLGRKQGGKIPLESVPDLFLAPARKIYKYFSTADMVVETTTKKQTISDRPKKRVVRSDASKRIAHSIDVPGMYERIVGMASSKPCGSLATMTTRSGRSSSRLVGY